ncbi:MAG: hypothetical protein IJG00_03795 [Clostridia bacterium]|nr:hypothetical protein [Clostridia bacterium]
MKFFKKITSVVLSVLMVSNFTFCRALEQPTDSEENKESSSIFPYVAAATGAGVAVAAIGLWAFCNRGYYNLGKTIPNVPANIKAIHWNKHRCWWMASVLFLYYWSEFKDFIYDNVGDKFASVQNKNCRDVLMDLNDIFKILDKCDGNVCYITEDESRMGKYFNNLKGLGNVVVVDNTPNYPLILNLLPLFYDEPALKRFNLETAEGAEYYDTFTGKVYDVKFMLSQIRDGHFYVYLEPNDGGKGFAIGISTLPDEETINICSLEWEGHPYYSLIKVFKDFKQ